MDDKDTAPNSTPDSTPSGNDPREELRDQLQAMGKAAQELLEHLVKVPATLAQIPLQSLPDDTATHARNAASEGFAAVRSLIDGISRSVDEAIRAQRDRKAASRNADSSTDNSADMAASTRALPPGEGHYHGGHGEGAGPSGTGSRDLDTDNPTIRLDEEP